jgi:hypothetical protein
MGLSTAISKPSRIRLSRARGWRKPKHTIVVSRPSKWGNPFSIETFGRELACALYERSVTGIWSPEGIPSALVPRAYRLHSGFRKAMTRFGLEVNQLRGFNLACWCAEGFRCHVDILLKLANEGPPHEGVSIQAKPFL